MSGVKVGRFIGAMFAAEGQKGFFFMQQTQLSQETCGVLHEVMTDSDHERHVRDSAEATHEKLSEPAATLELRVGKLAKPGPSPKLFLLASAAMSDKSGCAAGAQNPRNLRNPRST